MAEDRNLFLAVCECVNLFSSMMLSLQAARAGQSWARHRVSPLNIKLSTHVLSSSCCSRFSSKCRANNAPLSPIPWLERAALLFPARTAVRYGEDFTMSYGDLAVRLSVMFAFTTAVPLAGSYRSCRLPREFVFNLARWCHLLAVRLYSLFQMAQDTYEA